MTDREGLDPLFDLGPLPGGEILFRPGATEDVPGSAPGPLSAVGLDPLDGSPVPPSAGPILAPASADHPGRRIPPPQTYSPTPARATTPRSGSAPAPATRTPYAPPSTWNPTRRPGGSGSPSAGGTVLGALRWVVRHPRLALGVGFALVALVGNLSNMTGGGRFGSSTSTDDPYPSLSSVETSGTPVDEGRVIRSGEMTYFPERLPPEVEVWQVAVDNLTTGTPAYVVEDETTGEVLDSGSTVPSGTTTFTLPGDRLEDRISLVLDASGGLGGASCRILADGVEVGSGTSDASLSCIYDPASLRP